MITPKGLALKYLPKIKQLDCLRFYLQVLLTEVVVTKHYSGVSLNKTQK